jgi:hypothetical protein
VEQNEGGALQDLVEDTQMKKALLLELALAVIPVGPVNKTLN